MKYTCEACGAVDSVDESDGVCAQCGATAMDSICCEGGYNCTDCPRERNKAQETEPC